jgi:hypothetical protein
MDAGTALDIGALNFHPGDFKQLRPAAQNRTESPGIG